MKIAMTRGVRTAHRQSLSPAAARARLTAAPISTSFPRKRESRLDSRFRGSDGGIKSPSQRARCALYALCFHAAVVVLCAIVPAHAQLASAKFIRIVTSEPGSTNDLSARLIAPDLTRALGQQVIVENRGSLAVEYTAKAPPDGNTLLYYGNSVWLLPLLRAKAPYDPLRDLAAVSLTTLAPVVLVVHPSLPVKSVRDIIALAKARPGQLNYAAGTIGASTHLSMELFKVMAAADIVRIPYKGTGPAVTALLGGEAHLMFSPLGSVNTHLRSGKLRALAVGSEQRSAPRARPADHRRLRRARL